MAGSEADLSGRAEGYGAVRARLVDAVGNRAAIVEHLVGQAVAVEVDEGQEPVAVGAVGAELEANRVQLVGQYADAGVEMAASSGALLAAERGSLHVGKEPLRYDIVAAAGVPSRSTPEAQIVLMGAIAAVVIIGELVLVEERARRIVLRQRGKQRLVVGAGLVGELVGAHRLAIIVHLDLAQEIGGDHLEAAAGADYRIGPALIVRQIAVAGELHGVGARRGALARIIDGLDVELGARNAACAAARAGVGYRRVVIVNGVAVGVLDQPQRPFEDVAVGVG